MLTSIATSAYPNRGAIRSVDRPAFPIVTATVGDDSHRRLRRLRTVSSRAPPRPVDLPPRGLININATARGTSAGYQYRTRSAEALDPRGYRRKIRRKPHRRRYTVILSSGGLVGSLSLITTGVR